MKLKRTHLVSIITNLMGLMALLCLVVFSIWATLCVRQAVSAVETSTSESSTYQQMLYVLAQEETLQYQYELTPSIALRQEHHANATTLSALIQILQQDSISVMTVLASTSWQSKQAICPPRSSYLPRLMPERSHVHASSVLPKSPLSSIKSSGNSLKRRKDSRPSPNSNWYSSTGSNK